MVILNGSMYLLPALSARLLFFSSSMLFTSEPMPAILPRPDQQQHHRHHILNTLLTTQHLELCIVTIRSQSLSRIDLI